MVEAVTSFVHVVAYQVLWGSFNKRWQSSPTREQHCMYYVCCLRETFWRDIAEMVPCWLYLVASFPHTFLIVHAKATDQWLLTNIEGLGANKLSSARAGQLSERAGLLTHFLTEQAGLLTHFLTLRAPDRFYSLIVNCWLVC